MSFEFWITFTCSLKISNFCCRIYYFATKFWMLYVDSSSWCYTSCNEHTAHRSQFNQVHSWRHCDRCSTDCYCSDNRTHADYYCPWTTVATVRAVKEVSLAYVADADLTDASNFSSKLIAYTKQEAPLTLRGQRDRCRNIKGKPQIYGFS